ncbi:MAG TPA: lipid-A-disaccharide synthase [Candidatus Marinimicrobia bacterium]|nr:lipid-A-disaccharide synthase [Candidatus Neomarinimicrobiota bacterium]HRS52370.1 lipid-A-disaccharide synthase [Candidatus Neomarinimicrobiota bacterium]HRU92981.1 lipid-A-disaccharide synthase [Candidatus Neomarinimicrobiota bacterium]
MSTGKIFISAGELSGDIHAGKLISALKELNPAIEISAIGGDNMTAAGARLLFHIRETSFMGFVEVIKHLPFIFSMYRKTLQFIDQFKPDAVVLIDYPGFNLRLAKALDRRDIPVIYYITPQVWAWHQSRVKKIRRYVREVLCILPFEATWFNERGVRATFVGHPLLDRNEISTSEPVCKIFKDGEPLIGLFPGSRQQEVDKHLPLMIESVKALRQEFPNLQAAVAVASGVNLEKYQKCYQFDWLSWHFNSTRAVIQSADVLIVASGTVTLEATLCHKPFVVIYRVAPLSYWLGKKLIKVPFISIANLIAEKKGVTELIQHDANVENIKREVTRILRDQSYANQIRDFLQYVCRQLGEPGASRRAAQVILNYLKS